MVDAEHLATVQTVQGGDIGPTAFPQLLFTPELSRGVLESWYTPLVGGEPVGYVNLYVADTETGSYEPVTPVTTEYKPFGEESDQGCGSGG